MEKETKEKGEGGGESVHWSRLMMSSLVMGRGTLVVELTVISCPAAMSSSSSSIGTAAVPAPSPELLCNVAAVVAACASLLQDMVHHPSPSPPPMDKIPRKHSKHRMNSKNPVVQSAYFAWREAAWVLRLVLQGDACRQATASIKSLVYGPSVRNKKATFALVCQSLKHLLLIKDVLMRIKLLSSKWKKQEELIYVTAYDVLFGQDIAMTGQYPSYHLIDLLI